MEGVKTGMEQLSTVITSLTGYMGDVVEMVATQPLMLVGVGISLFAGVIMLVKRLI